MYVCIVGWLVQLLTFFEYIMSMCPNDWDLFPPNSTAADNILKKLSEFGSAYGKQHGYICMVLCSFGIVTNILHIIILTRPTMRNSAVNVLLVAVAGCDSLTMTTYLIYIIQFVVIGNACSFATYSWMSFLNFHSISSIYLHSTSLWLAVGMAFVRRMTLKQARLYSRWQSPQYAVKICVIVYICVMVLWIPTVLSQQVIQVDGSYCHDPMVNESYTLDIAHIAKMDNCLLYKINLWVTGIVYKIVPCILLGWLSFGLLSLLRRAEKKRRLLVTAAYTPTGHNNNGRRNNPPQAHSKARKRSDRTTIMLIVILLVFLVTELPQGALAVLNAIYTSSVNLLIYPAVADFIDLLSLLNSSVNFLLYCVMSSRYRQTFWKVILPRVLYAHYISHFGDTKTTCGTASVANTKLGQASPQLINKNSKSDLTRPVGNIRYCPSVIEELSENGSISSSRKCNYSTNENLHLSSSEEAVSINILGDIQMVQCNVSTTNIDSPARKSKTFSGKFSTTCTSPHVSPCRRRSLKNRKSFPFLKITNNSNVLQTPSLASLRSTPSYGAETSENRCLLFSATSYSFADSFASSMNGATSPNSEDVAL